MKKSIVYLIVLSLASFTVSCKTETKKEVRKQENRTTTKNAAYNLQEAKSEINWTAYKTTEKIPVKGRFNKVKITSGGTGESIKEAIDGAEFSVPVSSIFTNDSGRDYKIKKFFFGVMDKTELLSGKFIIENDSMGYSDITMNGITKKLPFKYSLKGKVFQFTGTMKITDWKAEKALESLNTVCKDLHKGADGISKTWDEVALNITAKF